MSIERLKDLHILVVDDDPDIRSSFELALKMEGAETAIAGDGSAAITACNENDFDAVVLDMMLPKASGFVVLENLKIIQMLHRYCVLQMFAKSYIQSTFQDIGLMLSYFCAF